MELKNLKLFIDVAKKLSFVQVAEDRNVDPSMVSKAISQLEGQLGCRLLHRTTRSMSLTQSGERYLERVHSLVEGIEEANESVKQDTLKPSGKVRMTCSIAYGESKVIPLMKEFHSVLPDIQLDLLLTDSNVDLNQESVDLAIRMAPALSQNLVVTKLHNTRYVLCASPHYADKHTAIDIPEDLMHHQCVSYSVKELPGYWRFRHTNTDTNTNKATPKKQDVLIHPDRGFSSSSPLSVLSMVRSGLGIGLLADWLCQSYLDSGELVRLLPDIEATVSEFETACWLAYPSRHYLPKRTRATIDFLKSKLFEPS